MTAQSTSAPAAPAAPAARDYAKDPSINAPASAEEARAAVIRDVYRSCTDPHWHGRALHQPFTEDMGFGMKRTSEQVEWLEDARQEVLAGLGRVLSEIHQDIDTDEIREAREAQAERARG